MTIWLQIASRNSFNRKKLTVVSNRRRRVLIRTHFSAFLRAFRLQQKIKKFHKKQGVLLKIRIFDALLDRLVAKKDKRKMTKLCTKIVQQKKLKRIIDEWNQVISQRYAQDVFDYLLNKAFQLLVKHMKQ